LFLIFFELFIPPNSISIHQFRSWFG
jgi:hypothetical protein